MMKFRLHSARKINELGESYGSRYFWFVLLAKNGKTLCTSETYKRRQGADKGIASAAGKNHYTIIDKTVLS